MPADLAATGPHVMRRINDVQVLQALRASQDATARVSDLVVATGLSRTAVTRALSSLFEAELVASVDAEQHQMGRPAVRVRFRAELGHVAGIEVGPHTMALVIADLAGVTRAERRVPIGEAPTGPELVRVLRTELAELVDEAGITAAELWAVAIGTPGIVDPRGEVVLVPSIPGWTGMPMLAGLREWLDCPVTLDHAAHLAVLAEQRLGDAGSTLLYVHWGERIGTGLMIEGRQHRGAGSAAGELGFIDVATPIDQTSELVTDGLGAFERLAGAEAIRRLAAEVCDAPLVAALRDAAPDLSPLFRAAADGDAAAASVIDRAGARMARGLATYLLLVDPGRVVIGGGLVHAGDLLVDAVRRHLEPLVLAPFELRASNLREKAVVAGAVQTALDLAEERLAALL